jgi:hypothetical protein
VKTIGPKLRAPLVIFKNVCIRVARFFLVPYKLYQITSIIPNTHKTQQMNIRYVYQSFPFQGLSKYAKIGIFGVKVNHLAALACILPT